MDFIVSHGTRSAGLPFSDAVRVGDVLCLSGQIGHKPGTLELVPGGIGPETRQMMENIARVLNAAGRSFDDVFKCTVMLADVSAWPEFNKVYLEYFKPERLPARSAFGTNGLALGAAVEMECWAWAGEGKGT
jgi:2-iminobutanoate/2-iminopropanoate deaminase